MLVSDIIEAARDRLGDADKTGWADDRLVRLVNAAQKDICKTVSLYRKKAYIPLANNIYTYSLPNDCYDITRVEYLEEQLPIYSREDIDNTLTMPSRYAVKSNINRGIIEIHPPFDDLEFFDNYVVGTTWEAPALLDQPLGVVAFMEDACVLSPLGVIVSMYDVVDDNEFTEYGDVCGSNLFGRFASAESNEGVLANISDDDIKDDELYGFLTNINYIPVEGLYGLCVGFVYDPNYVTVYYNATPPKISWVNSATVLEELWFDAFVHYVVGYARQDDNDEGNYKIGEAEISKYYQEVAKARKITAKSFNSQQTAVRETIYRRF